MELDKRLIMLKTKLILNNPILGSLLLKMDMVEDEQQELPDGSPLLMGVDISNNILVYNSKNLEQISDDMLLLVLAHESMHVLNGTIIRKGNRDHYLWNIATDFEINWMLQDMGFKATDFPGLLYNEEIHSKNMIAEEIYEKLPKMKSSKGGKGKSSRRSSNGKCGEEDQDFQGFDKVKEPTTCDEIRKAKINHQSAMVSASQMPGYNESDKGIGSVPATLRRLIDKYTTSKVSWKDYFSAYITGVCRDDFSYRRCSPGFIPQNIYLPTLYSPTTKAFVIVDTSGSIGTKELKLFLGEVKEMLWMFDVSFMSCDANVGAVAEDVTEMEDVLKACVGGGGTSFAPAFKWIDENMHEDLNLVLMTDGYNGDSHIDRPLVVKNLIALTTTDTPPSGIDADIILHISPSEED